MNKILLPSLLFLVAFFMLNSCAEKIKLHSVFYFEGVTTKGVVISIETKHRRKNRDLSFLTVAYTVNEHEFVLKSQNGLSWPFVPGSGELVNVIYQPDKPEKSEVFSMWNFYFLPALQLIFGFLCLGWGASLILRKLK